MDKYRFFFIALVVLIVGSVAYFTYDFYTVVNNVEAKVDRVQYITDCQTRDSKVRCDSYYIVYTDKGVFKLTSGMSNGGFSVHEFAGKLKENTSYNFKTRGSRNHYLGMIPYIVSINKPIE